MDTRMQAREYNIELGYPTLEEGLKLAKCSLLRSINNRDRCIYYVHGYGRSGAGGVIRIALRKWLDSQLKKGVIKAVIYGEDFSIFNVKCLELKNKYKGLEKFLDTYNPGITIVEL